MWLCLLKIPKCSLGGVGSLVSGNDIIQNGLVKVKKMLTIIIYYFILANVIHIFERRMCWVIAKRALSRDGKLIMK